MAHAASALTELPCERCDGCARVRPRCVPGMGCMGLQVEFGAKMVLGLHERLDGGTEGVGGLRSAAGKRADGLDRAGARRVDGRRRSGWLVARAAPACFGGRWMVCAWARGRVLGGAVACWGARSTRAHVEARSERAARERRRMRAERRRACRQTDGLRWLMQWWQYVVRCAHCADILSYSRLRARVHPHSQPGEGEDGIMGRGGTPARPV